MLWVSRRIAPRSSSLSINGDAFAECITSRSSVSSEMKGGNYEFCTYGRLVPMKTDANTGEPTELLIMAGPNGNEVYGRDRLTGAWGRWTLGPGQRMTATIGEDGQFKNECSIPSFPTHALPELRINSRSQFRWTR
jgi:hypothetical protein